jgi:hypothetical protein
MSLQEKFQVIVPGKAEAAEPWASFESARECPDACPEDGEKFNSLTPGMEINNSLSPIERQIPLKLAGAGDQSDVVSNPENMIRGHSELKMKGCDDQYTGEHLDHFYGDSGGFAERNNYLDRL